MITENLEDKNPKDSNGFTPLHHAALNGHLDICKLIMEQVENQNPGNVYGDTPFHWAAGNNQLDVCKLFFAYSRGEESPR